MATLAQLQDRFDARFDIHILTTDIDVPVVSRLACQGDVAIVRRDDLALASSPIPSQGATVVSSESGGNTHSLHGGGLFDRNPDGLRVGVLTVLDGESVFLLHPEHGGFEIAPGTYEIRRQREREQAEATARFVAD